MKTNVIIVCLALIFSGSQVFAQLTKEEKKSEKKAKEYRKNPASLKDLTEAKQVADNSVTKLTAENKQLQSTVSDKNAKIKPSLKIRFPACAANSLPLRLNWLS